MHKLSKPSSQAEKQSAVVSESPRYATKDSQEFRDQMMLFAFLHGFAKGLRTADKCGFSAKLCLTCWSIVSESEYSSHEKHQYTGEFHLMAAATQDSVAELCRHSKKTEPGNSDRF